MRYRRGQHLRRIYQFVDLLLKATVFDPCNTEYKLLPHHLHASIDVDHEMAFAREDTTLVGLFYLLSFFFGSRSLPLCIPEVVHLYSFAQRRLEKAPRLLHGLRIPPQTCLSFPAVTHLSWSQLVVSPRIYCFASLRPLKRKEIN